MQGHHPTSYPLPWNLIEGASYRNRVNPLDDNNLSNTVNTRHEGK